MFFSLFLMAFQAMAAGGRGALFKVTGSGNTLYLYGTIHAGRADFYPLEPRIRAAMAAARTLALEIDATRDPAFVANVFRRHGTFAPGSPGIAGLPAERRQHIENGLKKQGVDPTAVAHMKPWLIGMVLVLKDIHKLGYHQSLGVDGHLLQMARSKKMRIAELESVQYQAAMLDRLPEQAQWQMLEEALLSMEAGTQLREVRAMFEAYERADQRALDGIVERIEADTSLTGQFARDVLLGERNGPMADKVAALLARENNAVVAVGLLHLLGQRGVPELLRKRGIKVERVY
jgi:uncharacterized protein YbaP (TraB family)